MNAMKYARVRVTIPACNKYPKGLRIRVFVPFESNTLLADVLQQARIKVFELTEHYGVPSRLDLF